MLLCTTQTKAFCHLDMLTLMCPFDDKEDVTNCTARHSTRQPSCRRLSGQPLCMLLLCGLNCSSMCQVPAPRHTACASVALLTGTSLATQVRCWRVLSCACTAWLCGANEPIPSMPCKCLLRSVLPGILAAQPVQQALHIMPQHQHGPRTGRQGVAWGFNLQ
jgi:hypothetical protein